MAVVEIITEQLKKRTLLSENEIIDGLTEIGVPTTEEGGVLFMEVTPNRPDFFSIEGVGRALLAYYRGIVKWYQTKPSKYTLSVDESVNKIRPFIAAAVVKGIEVDEEFVSSIMQLQEKLHDTIGRRRKKVAIGIHNLDKVVFPLEYTAVKTAKFVPLDFTEEMDITGILKKHPKGREYGGVVPAPLYPLLKDSEGVISLPPIINAERTRVVNNTKNILVEVTGTHEETTEITLNIICCALADRDGIVYEVKVGKKKYPDLSWRRMKLDLNSINKLLGIDVKKQLAINYLKRMGYAVDGDAVLVPPYRADVVGMPDIAEDIAIAYGYNEFKPTLPNFFTVGKTLYVYEDIARMFDSMGFLEVKTNILTNEEALKINKYNGVVMKIANPSNREYTVIRPTLSVGMLSVLAENKMRGLPQKIYEIGDSCASKLEKRLAFAITDKNVDFPSIRGVLQTLMKELELPFELEAAELPLFEKWCCGVIKINDKPAGVIGIINKTVLQNYKNNNSVAYCELNLEALRPLTSTNI